MFKTPCQYLAASSSPLQSRIWINESKSFSKQLPPNAGLGLRNLSPIRWSAETIDLTSWILHYSNFSVRPVIEFIELILWASIALDISFPSSADAFRVLMILVLWVAILYLKSSDMVWRAASPFLESGVPMTILSGLTKFWMAYPSAKNSGIDTKVNKSEIWHADWLSAAVLPPKT